MDWTNKEDKLLKDIFHDNSKSVLMEKFPDRSWSSITMRARRLKLNRDPKLVHEDRIDRKPRCDGFQPHEDAILKEIYEKNSKAFIQEKFPDINWGTILRRGVYLGLKRSKALVDIDRTIRGPRKDTWTPEELNLLREIFVNNTKEFILGRFQGTRSWQAIRLNATKIGLFRDPEIIKQEMIEGGKTAPIREDFWSPVEDLLLKEIYEHNSQEFIKDKFPDRTWKAIRGHCTRLGLERDRALYLKESHEKSIATMQKNHGVDYSTQLSGMHEKSRQTNLERRGVDYALKCPEVRKKIKKTVQERFGVDNVFQDKTIQDRTKAAMYCNGTQKCSKQQAYIANLLKGDINYPVGNCSIDILIDKKYACEYDGGGHFLNVILGSTTEEEFLNSERRRDRFLKSKGFSIIRIISKTDKLPSDSVLINMISESKKYLSKGHSWITFNIDDKKLICKKIQRNYDFGLLRKIP